MTASSLACDRLAAEEGFRSKIYLDTVGKRTIGYGCNLDAGWSPGLARCVLEYQLEDVRQALAGAWWYAGLDDARVSVILDLGFNMGTAGLLHFPKMLAAIGHKYWQGAHDELLNSDAARMLPARYGALARILLTGVST